MSARTSRLTAFRVATALCVASLFVQSVRRPAVIQVDSGAMFNLRYNDVVDWTITGPAGKANTQGLLSLPHPSVRRTLFPCLFLLFTITYWSYYNSITGSPDHHAKPDEQVPFSVTFILYCLSLDTSIMVYSEALKVDSEMEESSMTAVSTGHCNPRCCCSNNDQQKVFSAKPRGIACYKRNAHLIDIASRVIFPILFIIFNIIYWVYYMIYGVEKVTYFQPANDHKNTATSGDASSEGFSSNLLMNQW